MSGGSDIRGDGMRGATLSKYPSPIHLGGGERGRWGR